MPSAVVIACVLSAVLVSVLALWIGRLKQRHTAAAFAARPLLNDVEFDFYRRLRHALPEYQVFPKVSLAALMGSTRAGRAGRDAEGRIAQTRIDYVIAARTDVAVLALVELDDRAHEGGIDTERDRLTGGAGYITHRFRCGGSPSPLAIREQVLGPPTAEIVPLPRPASPDR